MRDCMVYQALDDRPNVCEGCKCTDFPSHTGPSTRQITWNNFLTLWLCVDCQYQWSSWYGSAHASEAAKRSKMPGFLKMLEKERAAGK